MNESLTSMQNHMLAFKKNWAWFFVWGVLLIVFGMFAISAAAFTTLLTVVFIGALLVLGGMVILVDTFTFWRHKASGFWLHLLIGILYVAVGTMLISNPVSASVSLTLLLAILYSAVGIFRIIYSLSLRMPRWGWSFFNGLVTLILGILILSQWPMTGLFVIGLFVGIDLVVCGWVYVMAALSSRA